MDPNKLLNRLKKELNCRTDIDLADALGKKSSQISTWRRKSNLTELELANLVLSARKIGGQQSIEAEQLFKKLKHKFKNQKE